MGCILEKKNSRNKDIKQLIVKIKKRKDRKKYLYRGNRRGCLPVPILCFEGIKSMRMGEVFEEFSPPFRVFPRGCIYI
jgi:hypothetical protein